MGTITKPTTFVDGTIPTAAQFNGDFDTIYNEFNGSITNANISASAAIEGSKIATTLTGKTLDHPLISDYADITDASGSPSAPSSGNTRLYTLAGRLTTRINGGTVARVLTSYGNTQSYTPSAAGTATLDLALSNLHFITMPAGNITIALSNENVGQCFLIRILQDAVGSRTVTWFSTIRWAGGSAPTLTSTASKADVLGFIVTGSGTYDGFVVGNNI